MGTNALTLDIIAETCGKEAARAATFIVRLPRNFRIWRTEMSSASRAHPLRKKVSPDIVGWVQNDRDVVLVSCETTTDVGFGCLAF